MSDITISSINESIVVDSRIIAERLGLPFEKWEHLVISCLGGFPSHLSVWNLLAIVRHSSLTGELTYNVVEVINNEIYPYMSESDRSTFSWLKMSILEGLSLDLKCMNSELGSIHPWFYENHKRLIEGSEIVPIKSLDKKRPDFLIKVDGVISPVECKLIFNKSGLNQLKTYMTLWGSPKGYAVANRFTITLPSNVIGIVKEDK